MEHHHFQWVNHHFQWVNHHFQWVNHHFQWVNHHFQWVNHHFQWVNHHFQWVNQLFNYGHFQCSSLSLPEGRHPYWPSLLLLFPLGPHWTPKDLGEILPDTAVQRSQAYSSFWPSGSFFQCCRVSCGHLERRPKSKSQRHAAWSHTELAIGRQ